MKVTHNAPSTSPSVDQAKGTDKASQAKAAKSNEKTRTQAAAAGRNSSVEISDNARLMQRAGDLVHAAPDMRADRVAALKQSIKDGTYNVDSAKIADRLVEEHLFGDFGKNHL